MGFNQVSHGLIELNWVLLFFFQYLIRFNEVLSSFTGF